jgi:hypothetical protein
MVYNIQNHCVSGICPSFRILNLCGSVVRVPDYRSEMDCASCEILTQFIFYVEESRPPLWSSGQSSWL